MRTAVRDDSEWQDWDSVEACVESDQDEPSQPVEKLEQEYEEEDLHQMALKMVLKMNSRNKKYEAEVLALNSRNKKYEAEVLALNSRNKKYEAELVALNSRNMECEAKLDRRNALIRKHEKVQQDMRNDLAKFQNNDKELQRLQHRILELNAKLRRYQQGGDFDTLEERVQRAEAEVKKLATEKESVEAELMQERGVEVIDVDTGGTDIILREYSESPQKRQKRSMELQQQAAATMIKVKQEKAELRCQLQEKESQVNTITGGMGYETHQKFQHLRVEAANKAHGEECKFCLEPVANGCANGCVNLLEMNPSE